MSWLSQEYDTIIPSMYDNMLSHIFLGFFSCGDSSYTLLLTALCLVVCTRESSYTLLLYCPLSGSMYRARLSMTVAVRVRRPIPDTRWRRRVGRENKPEGGGRERGREEKEEEEMEEEEEEEEEEGNRRMEVQDIRDEECVFGCQGN